MGTRRGWMGSRFRNKKVISTKIYESLFWRLVEPKGYFYDWLCAKMFGKVLCQSLSSSTGYPSASLAYSRSFMEKIWLWHAFGESSSVREKKSFGQSSQREGCSSNMASLERILELMGLKSQEEVGSGSNIVP